VSGVGEARRLKPTRRSNKTHDSCLDLTHQYSQAYTHTHIHTRKNKSNNTHRDIQVGLLGELGVQGRREQAVVPPGVDLVLDVEDGLVVLFLCVCVCMSEYE
jgi:hypothetical protein